MYNWRLACQHSRCNCGQVLYASSGNSHTNGKQVHFEDDKNKANNRKKETKEGDNHGVEERAGTREGAAPAKPYLEAARQGLEADGLLGKHPQLAKLLQEAAESKAEPAEPTTPKTPDEDELHRQHKAAVQKTKEASERKGQRLPKMERGHRMGQEYGESCRRGHGGLGPGTG